MDGPGEDRLSTALGRWRATYTPGEWVVLSGPTSLVVLEPPTHEWAALINTLWDEVVASSPSVDLASRLAKFNLDELPSFGAFFWTEDGMRSLVRGQGVGHRSRHRQGRGRWEGHPNLE